MTREIKFRAKRIDNGRWAYGHYVKTPITTEFDCDGQFLDCGTGRHCIIQNQCAHEIDIKTLGRYTGLEDKNGKKIWEGDIVFKFGIDDAPCEVKYGEQKISHDWLGVGFYAESLGEQENIFGGKYIEVVGDKHSNPELIK